MKLFNAIVLCGLFRLSTAVETVDKVTRHLRRTKFQDGDELRAAVALYLSGNPRQVAQVISTYGGPIGRWDVSLVQEFASMFSANRVLDAANFNEDISSWDVSSAINLIAMFEGATAFNQDISSWDVSSATRLDAMFNAATAFNQDISSWNVSSATSMNVMFAQAAAFNQDISSWDVSHVSDFGSMFAKATSFNQDISSWNVLSAVFMGGMFFQATAFNQDISNWDVSHVVDFNSMFFGASAFNQTLCNWNSVLKDLVSGVPNIGTMFTGSGCPNQDDPVYTAAATVKWSPLCDACV